MCRKCPSGIETAELLSQLANSFEIRGANMGDKGGSKDKGKKEKQKKAKLSPKEKRKAQKEKKNK